MKKKGFTLIELLAVIIILAVIALIATPIVLNVVENAKKQANKNSVYGIIDSAKLYYTESLLDSSKTSSINGTTNLIDEIKVSGNKPDSGELYINNKGQTAIAVVYDNVCYKKNFTDNNLTESEDITNCSLNVEVPVKNITLTYDSNNNANADVGDIITVKSKENTNEEFYVISNDGTNIKALARYNLKVGIVYDSGYIEYQENEMTYLQDEDMRGYQRGQGQQVIKGLTVFSLTSNEYSGSIVEGYVNAYKNKLPNEVINASLITKEELIALGCDESNHTCLDAPNFVMETSYWSSSPCYDYSVWGVYSAGSFDIFEYDYVEDLGVRPVITISKSDI